MAGGGLESSLRLTDPQRLRWDLLSRMEISEVGIGTEDVQAAPARFSRAFRGSSSNFSCPYYLVAPRWRE
ncbi:hypothetical protein SLA2020_398030 [Shorea laevis]